MPRTGFTTSIVGLTLVLLLAPSAALAQPGTVEELIVQGLSRMTREAFFHALGIQQGDPYDPTRIRARFKAMWQLRLFEDITIEAEDAPGGGKALIIKVKERPVLSSITYEENSEVTRTQIEDRYKERGLDLRLGKPLDLGAVYFAESAIRDLLSEKGYLDADVEAQIQRVTETSRALHFAISAGGKTRIRRIEFKSTEVFSNRKLESELELTQERKWYWPWSSKNLYHPIKWDQDVAGLRKLYQRQGYLDVEIRAPVVEVRKSKRAQKKAEKAAAKKARREAKQSEPQPEPEPAVAGTEAPAKPLTPKQQKKLAAKQKKKEDKARAKAKKAKAKEGKRWVYLTADVSEGPQYRLGEITVTGNEVFPDAFLRGQITLAEGDVLDATRLEYGVNRIGRLYEDRGYLYSNAVQRIQRREGADVADVEVVVDEDEPYYVGRIEFRGNSATHDRVLRREMLLMEGDLFNRSRLDVSRSKVNQLGYFQITEEPLIEAIEDENRVRVTMIGEEQGRNEIQVGGGYSGLDGAFFNGVYSTRNFLGRGQIVSTALQIGGRSNRYQLSFQEPWFMGRPYLLGVSLFRRDTDFGSTLRSTSSGGGIIVGKRVKRNSRINLGYNYEQVESTQFSLGQEIFDAESDISSLTPIYSFSTINNPYRPTRGTSFTISTQVAGGPLGGNTSYFRPLVNFTAYRRAFGRTHFAVHAEAGIVREFGDDSDVASSANIEGVPSFQRFWLGGETLGPRVFDTRTITPRRFVRREDGVIVDVVGEIPPGTPVSGFVTLDGVPVPVEVGGDRMYLLQSEFVVPLNEQADLAFFVDAGDALFEDTSLDFSTIRVSAGLELRFHLPIFPVPLRLIYGQAVRELDRDRTSNFTFSIGRSF